MRHRVKVDPDLCELLSGIFLVYKNSLRLGNIFVNNASISGCDERLAFGY